MVHTLICGGYAQRKPILMGNILNLFINLSLDVIDLLFCRLKKNIYLKIILLLLLFSTEHLTAVVGGGSARTSATCSLASSRESSTSNQGSQQPFR